jgi:hypothetical protein
MRKYLLSILFFVALMDIHNVKAQLANGSAAPDWTLTDLNGNSWNLHAILDQQKSAILDFSATWCSICWNYHNTNALKTTYNNYGPSGTNKSTVFFIEPDLSTSVQCLSGTAGCTGGTKGDWTAGTPYPIINLTNNTVSSAYQIFGYPTVLGISPDKRVWQVGTASAATLANWVGQSFEMALTSNITNAYCSNNGAIDLTVTNGYLSKTYLWSNGATTQDISGLGAGTYTVKVTDANGYFISKSYTIAGPSTFMNLNNFTQTNLTCNGASNGSISVNPQGGNGGYSYQWSNGGNSSSITNLSAAAYYVVVTDVQGCTISANYNITQPAAITLSAATSIAACSANNGSATITAGGGSGSYTFQLSNNTPSTSNVFSGLSAGTYSYTVIDGNACTKNAQFTINGTSNPTAQTTAPQQINCSTSEVSVLGTGSATGSNITYLWTTTTGSIVSGANTINALVDAEGEYNLLVTNTQTSCTANSAVTVTKVNNAPIANAGNNAGINCAVPQTTLNASSSSSGSNFTYQWSTPNGNIVSGLNTPTPIVDKGGTYIIEITNSADGCTSLDSVNVVEDKIPPAISVTNGVLTCGQPMSEICATSVGSSIVWTINGMNSNSNCITVTNSGTYVATATSNSNGCTATAVSNVMNAADLPQISATSPAPLTCTTTSTAINGMLIGNISNHTIEWTTTDGNIVSGANTLTPLVNQAGNYKMTAVNIASQCASTFVVYVASIINTPIAQFTSINANGQLTLSNNSPSTNGTVSWTYNGQSASGNAITISFPVSGTYNICMTYSNECGTNTKCVDVVYATALAFSGEVINAKCNDGSASILLNISGGFTAPLSYAWTGPNGFVSGEQSLSGLAVGTYTCIITDAAGISVSQTFNVTEPSAINATAAIINTTNNQANGSINLTIEGGTGNYVISWSNGGIGNSISNLSAGAYSATVVDQNNCTKLFGPFVVEGVTSNLDLSIVNELSIYPNPTSGALNLKLGLDNVYDIRINIYDNQGQLIENKKLNGSSFNILFNTNDYLSGIYLVEVQTPKGTTHRKLFKVD